MMLRRLDERTCISGQLRVGDVEAAKAEGIAMIVNNRPDGEDPAQPRSSEIEAAAREAGLAYRFIPVAGGLTRDQVDQMIEAMASADGPLLAYCTSGTRSTFLWALAEAARGSDGEEILEKAARAGYDLSAIATLLRAG